MARDHLREHRRRQQQLETLKQMLVTVGENLEYYKQRAESRQLTDQDELDQAALDVRRQRIEASITETEQRVSSAQEAPRG
jgi:hypothetical protein